MIRKLWLKNENGFLFEFTDFNQTLVTNVSGLGALVSNTYVEYANNYKKIEDKIPLTSINLTLIFMKGYKGFKKFSDYLFKSKTLMLFISTDAATRYCYIQIAEIPKTELKSNSLICDLKLEKTR
jgi:hypothetical protein